MMQQSRLFCGTSPAGMPLHGVRQEKRRFGRQIRSRNYGTVESSAASRANGTLLQNCRYSAYNDADSYLRWRPQELKRRVRRVANFPKNYNLDDTERITIRCTIEQLISKRLWGPLHRSAPLRSAALTFSQRSRSAVQWASQLSDVEGVPV